jgi:hypothetical protein
LQLQRAFLLLHVALTLVPATHHGLELAGSPLLMQYLLSAFLPPSLDYGTRSNHTHPTLHRQHILPLSQIATVLDLSSGERLHDADFLLLLQEPLPDCSSPCYRLEANCTLPLRSLQLALDIDEGARCIPPCPRLHRHRPLPLQQVALPALLPPSQALQLQRAFLLLHVALTLVPATHHGLELAGSPIRQQELLLHDSHSCTPVYSPHPCLYCTCAQTEAHVRLAAQSTAYEGL